MTARTRRLLFALGAAGATALLVWGLMGLPDFGHYRGPYGLVLDRRALPERHATNVVSAVVFDYRGFDTVGEEFILFAAVIGVTMLLRAQREETEPPPHERGAARRMLDASDALRVAGLGLIAPTVLLGAYLVIHGHLTPGGGFQGGAILAGAPVLLYLVGRSLQFRQIDPTGLLDLGEGLGAAGFAAIGLIGLAAGAAYLSNVWPLGQIGSVFSAGTFPVINLAIGLEVSVGVVFVVYEFVEQTLMVRTG